MRRILQLLELGSRRLRMLRLRRFVPPTWLPTRQFAARSGGLKIGGCSSSARVTAVAVRASSAHAEMGQSSVGGNQHERHQPRQLIGGTRSYNRALRRLPRRCASWPPPHGHGTQEGDGRMWGMRLAAGLMRSRGPVSSAVCRDAGSSGYSSSVASLP